MKGTYVRTWSSRKIEAFPSPWGEYKQKYAAPLLGHSYFACCELAPSMFFLMLGLFFLFFHSWAWAGNLRRFVGSPVGFPLMRTFCTWIHTHTHTLDGEFVAMLSPTRIYLCVRIVQTVQNILQKAPVAGSLVWNMPQIHRSGVLSDKLPLSPPHMYAYLMPRHMGRGTKRTKRTSQRGVAPLTLSRRESAKHY